jgi:hypothetical protein
MSHHDISSGLKIKLTPDEARDSARVQQDIERLLDYVHTEDLDHGEVEWLQVRVKSLTAAVQAPKIAQRPEKEVKGATLKVSSEGRALLSWISTDFVLLGTGAKPVAYHIESGDRLGKESFELYCAKHYGDVVHSVTDSHGNVTDERLPAGSLWWKWNDPERRVVRRLVMEPTHLPEHEDPCSAQAYNRWHMLKKTMVVPNMDATFDDIGIFAQHLMYLADNDAPTVEFILCWLAQLYQHPSTKMPTALFFVSEAEGVGKNLATKILKPIFGPPLYGKMDGSQLRKGFTDAIEGKRIVEITELSSADTRDAMDKLKNLISELDYTFEGKGTKAHSGQNFAHFILSANNLDAVRISNKERRFAVIRCTADPKPQSYYDDLGRWVEGDGAAMLAGVLAKWEFPAHWSINAKPPETAAKQAAREASRSPQAQAIAGRIADRLPPFERDLGFLGDRRDPESGNEASGVVTRLNSLGLSCSFNETNTAAAIKQCGGKKLAKGTAASKCAWCWRESVVRYWDGRSLKEWSDHIHSGEVPDDYAAWVAAHGSKGDE